MKISEVYQKYNIPPNLQEHMLMVAGVALFIADNWKGPRLDKISLEKTCLIHDLGNIVKFDLDKYPEFLGSEQKNLKLWKNRQKEMISKYGRNDHEVTESILKELNYSNDSIEVVASKSLSNAVGVLKSNNWSLKIMLYSDMRVMPFGICSLEERLKDITDRLLQYNKRNDLEDLLEAVRSIEKQIQKHIKVSLQSINSDSVKLDDETLLKVDI